MITRRDIAVAFIAITGTLAVVGAQQAPPAILGSRTFDWDSTVKKEVALGSTRAFFRGATVTLAELEMHVTTLNPGQTSHAPHQHANEELIIIKEGTIEALVNGEWKKLGVGSVIFQASNQLHGIRNVGNGPTTYHVI